MAIDTGTERLTTDLLDTVAINLGNRPDGSRTAPEIPDIPTTSPGTPPRKRGRSQRNTVFDDRGTPGSSTTTASPALARSCRAASPRSPASHCPATYCAWRTARGAPAAAPRR